MIKAGKLPTISYLINNGSYGKIDSTLNSVTSINSAVIWTSIATGRQPDKHGISEWTFFDNKLKTIIPFRSYHCRERRIWDILSQYGKRAGVYRWLITYPPERINGFIVSDYFKNGLHVTEPEAISFELKKIPRSDDRRALNETRFNSKYESIIQKNLDEFSSDVENIRWLKDNQPVDFLAFYTKCLDTIQHYFWKFMEPNNFVHKLWHLDEEGIGKYKDIIKNFYEKIDLAIGKLIEDLDKNTIIIIVADHGFCPNNDLSNWNLSFGKILSEVGLLTFEEDSTNQDPLKSKILFYRKKNMLYITINLSDKKSKQFIAEKDRLIDLISSIRFENGDKIYEIVDYNPNEKSYDLTARLAVGVKNYLDSNLYIDQKKYTAAGFIEPVCIDISGEHDRRDGVVIFYDPLAKKIRRRRMIKASVLDIAPTILYLSGLPIARDMDGKVLVDAISPVYLKRNPLRYIDSYENKDFYRSSQEDKNISYDKEVLERLRSLGYID